jgi:hypothetical protein
VVLGILFHRMGKLVVSFLLLLLVVVVDVQVLVILFDNLGILLVHGDREVHGVHVDGLPFIIYIYFFCLNIKFIE